MCDGSMSECVRRTVIQGEEIVQSSRKQISIKRMVLRDVKSGQRGYMTTRQHWTEATQHGVQNGDRCSEREQGGALLQRGRGSTHSNKGTSGNERTTSVNKNIGLA